MSGFGQYAQNYNVRALSKTCLPQSRRARPDQIIRANEWNELFAKRRRYSQHAFSSFKRIQPRHWPYVPEREDLISKTFYENKGKHRPQRFAGSSGSSTLTHGGCAVNWKEQGHWHNYSTSTHSSNCQQCKTIE